MKHVVSYYCAKSNEKLLEKVEENEPPKIAILSLAASMRPRERSLPIISLTKPSTPKIVRRKHRPSCDG